MSNENRAYIREFHTCLNMGENELSLCAFTTVAACESWHRTSSRYHDPT